MRRSPPDSRPTGVFMSFRSGSKIRQDAFLALLAGPPRFAREGAGVEMLFDGQSLKDLVALRHDGEALADDLVRVAARPLAARAADLLAVEKDRAALPAGKPGDGVEAASSCRDR